MSFYRKIELDDGLIGIWKLDEKPEELLNLIQLSTEELESFRKIKFERRQKEFLVIRIILSQLLNDSTRIEYLKNGKPILQDRHENISISHSQLFVCVYISGKKVGIDVELSTRPIDRVATRFLHPGELKFISGLTNQQLAKILYWSAKEAIFKCSPESGIQFSEQIRITPFYPDSETHFTGQLFISEKTLNYRLAWEQFENNVLVYCVEE